MGTADYWRFQKKGKAERINIDGSLRCNSGHGLTNAALKGIGLIQLPDYYIASYIDSGKLIPLLEQYQEADEGVWAIYPDKFFLPFKIKTFIEFVKSKLE